MKHYGLPIVVATTMSVLYALLWLVVVPAVPAVILSGLYSVVLGYVAHVVAIGWRYRAEVQHARDEAQRAADARSRV